MNRSQTLDQTRQNFLSKYLFRFSILLLFVLTTLNIFSQTATPTPPDTENPDELIRINTNLIQTGVVVLDQKGKFVNNLKQEDFELKIDGRIVPVSFFEIFSGQVSPNAKKSVNTNTAAPVSAFSGGRNVLFVVDDVHLAFENFKRTKDLIVKFLETEKKPEDFVAIVSATGKIGFLQQFTNDEKVLRAALARLTASRSYSASDKLYPPMNEFEAQEIDRGVKEVTDVFVELALRDYPLNLRNDPRTIENVTEQIRSRAKTILFQSQIISKSTYSVLEQSLRLAGNLGGRKIVYFLSDGFLLDLANTNSAAQIDRIVDAATRANAVIYTIDTRGLNADLPDGTAASFSRKSGEIFESQDALSAFAKRTGGAFVHNTNGLQAGITAALIENSNFYLLGWNAEDDEVKKEKLRRIEIVVRGRPELQVKTQSGYLNITQTTAEKTKITQKNDVASKNENVVKSDLSASDRDLQKALFSFAPIRNLDAEVLLNFINKQPDGAVLIGNFQISGNQLQPIQENGKSLDKVEIVGIIFDSDGNRVEYFNKLLTVDYAENSIRNVAPDLYYNFQTNLKPGLYQIRTVARDSGSGRIGSTNQWIEIPVFSANKLQLSSLFLTEHRKTAETSEKSTDKSAKDSTENSTVINAAKRFARSSFLQYQFFIYNFVLKTSATDFSSLNARLNILRGGKVIASIPFDANALRRDESAQLSYAAEIPLNSLLPGRYEFQSIVNNIATGEKVVQDTTFEIY